MTTRYLATDISWDEAPNGVVVLHAYGDPLTRAEPWTIGFGSTGADIRKDTVWTPEYAAERRDMMILDVIDHLSYHLNWWRDIDDVRQDVFVNMGYQMGWQGLLKFTSTLSAASRHSWETCAADMRASLWYRQTHNRAARLIEQMRTGIRIPRSYDAGIPDLQPTPVTVPAKPTKDAFMSFLSKYVFDPLFNAVARSQTSVNVTQQANGTAALSVIIPAPANNTTNSDTAHLSPMGQLSPEIAALETALNNAVAGYMQSLVTADVPVVGGIAAPWVGAGVRSALVFAENHAMNYLAGVFHFHSAANAAPPTGTGA